MSIATPYVEACTCILDIRQDIWQCPTCKGYRKTDKRYTSVSRIKSAVLPEDYSGIDVQVLENARVKGWLVDRYFCECLLHPGAMLSSQEFSEIIRPRFQQDRYKTPAQHSEDARIRLDLLLNWWEKSGYKMEAVQPIFHSDSDLTAGAADITTADMILDIKLVSQLQPSYKLQMGAYRSMDGTGRKTAIIHVKKDRVELVHYELNCVFHWQNAVRWFYSQKELRSA